MVVLVAFLIGVAAGGLFERAISGDGKKALDLWEEVYDAYYNGDMVEWLWDNESRVQEVLTNRKSGKDDDDTFNVLGI